jgi:superfamily II DNA/RNA helicase
MILVRELALQVKDEIMSLRYKDQEDFIVTAIYGGSGV